MPTITERDRPAPEGDAMGGIVVTPAMMAAGARILEDLYDASPYSAPSTARDIFIAMMGAASEG